jgi:DNA invertase Pin-like site-specific DNA recombinase
MATVGYARVSSTGQDFEVQVDKLAGCERVFKEKRSGVDGSRPELKRCLDYLREGDTFMVTKIDRLARSTTDLYRIISTLIDKGVAFKVIDDPTIDTTSRTGKLVMGSHLLSPNSRTTSGASGRWTASPRQRNVVFTSDASAR